MKSDNHSLKQKNNFFISISPGQTDGRDSGILKLCYKHFLKNFQDSSFQMFFQSQCCSDEVNLMKMHHQPQPFGGTGHVLLFFLSPSA